VLSVIDSGVGMDEETTKRVFDPFFTTKNPGQGFGLGLATVRDLVALCGGQVRLNTTPEQGTRFDVYIPALNASALRLASTAERPAQRSRPNRSKKILLVDDDGVIRRTLARLLRSSGFEVLESGSLDQALAYVERGAVDLVVLDAKERGIIGPQVHERFLAVQPKIRTIFALSSARSDALSANPPREDLMMLRKPFTFQQLLAVVEGLLAS
jgi:CheY-like chemotaxis protein